MTETRRWTIGTVEVVQVVENVLPVPPDALVPGLSEHIDANADWAKPWAIDEDNQMRLSFHTFVVRSAGLVIAVDTCVGEVSQRGIPVAEDFPERLEIQAQLRLDEVDIVLCTHLHFDHVGWNLRTINGERVPTFSNARYLFDVREIDHLHDDPDAAVVAPSVQPILDRDMAQLVEAPHEITPEVRLVPTPGHTPGHVSVLISSNGAEALITGDVVHSPIQFAEPTLAASFDRDPQLATATRRELIDRYANTGVMLLGTHFPSPTSGRLRRADGKAWFDVSSSSAG